MSKLNVDIKQVIIVREDLKKFGLSVGKLAAQVAHGSLEAYRYTLRKKGKEVVKQWLIQGQKKIILRAKNLESLLKLYKKAITLGLPAVVIRDAGLTELPPGTITVVAIGPWYSREIDKVTGMLPLLKEWCIKSENNST